MLLCQQCSSARGTAVLWSLAATMSSADFRLGERIEHDGQAATIRYIGPVPDKSESWLGIEYDEPSRGKHSGTVGRVELFDCEYARILALMAAHVPNAEKSMQNRLRPINWESVIDVVSAHGIVRPEFVTFSSIDRYLSD